MTKPNEPAANAAAKPKAKAIPPAEKMLRVLDKTAKQGPGGERKHVLIINGLPKEFTFEFTKPLSLPFAEAQKFLQHDNFVLIDDNGNQIVPRRLPKQPHELGAGETLAMADDEVIARLDELNNAALLARAVLLKGGEQFVDKPERRALIDFLVGERQKSDKINKAAPDIGADDFVPEADLDDEAA